MHLRQRPGRHKFRYLANRIVVMHALHVRFSFLCILCIFVQSFSTNLQKRNSLFPFGPVINCCLSSIISQAMTVAVLMPDVLMAYLA